MLLFLITPWIVNFTVLAIVLKFCKGWVKRFCNDETELRVALFTYSIVSIMPAFGWFVLPVIALASIGKLILDYVSIFVSKYWNDK